MPVAARVTTTWPEPRLLRGTREGRPDGSLAFEGETGPRILSAHALHEDDGIAEAPGGLDGGIDVAHDNTPAERATWTRAAGAG